jgi:RNA polymerase sigma-70 factor (ECF subfamily)
MTRRIEELYVRHGAMVHRRCRAILGNDEEALDGVQEVFLKLAEDRVNFDAVASMTAYLFGMATHYSLNRLKREHRSVSPGEDLDGADPAGAPEDGWQRRIFLESLFARVEPLTRELAWYRWVDRMNWDEVALASGLSVSGTRKRLAKLASYASRWKEARP